MSRSGLVYPVAEPPVAGPLTLNERLQAVRSRRTASRVSTGTKVAAWVVGVTALLAVAAGGLLKL